MFDTVLNRAHVPKRQIGTGAAFAIAFFAWALVAAFFLSRGGKEDKKEAVEVTFVAALPPPPPPPPPPPGGGVKPKTPKIEKPKIEVDPEIYKDSKEEKKPEEKPKEEVKEDTPQAGGMEGGVDGGVAGGVVGGVVGGVIGGVLGGTLGGTGTALPPAAPPTFSTLSIGDPNLDQTSCPAVGMPPYPQEARTAKVETTLVASCVVETSGSLTCNLLKTHPFFETSTKAFLAAAHVKPFTAHGTPVKVRCNYPFRFKLE